MSNALFDAGIGLTFIKKLLGFMPKPNCATIFMDRSYWGIHNQLYNTVKGDFFFDDLFYQDALSLTGDWAGVDPFIYPLFCRNMDGECKRSLDLYY